MAWKDLKSVICDSTQTEFLKLIADLYSLNEENRTFLHTRYSIGNNPLKPYKEIISDALYPDVMMNEPIQLSVGKKAIADYYKATKDKVGQIELMVYYVETGNQFTLDMGDMYEAFYASLESMFDRVLREIEKQPNKNQIKFLPHLSRIVVSAKDMGWGYYDYISGALEDFNDKYTV